MYQEIMDWKQAYEIALFKENIKDEGLDAWRIL